MLSSCRSGNFDLANKEVTDVISEGYPVSQMLSQVLPKSTMPVLTYRTCHLTMSGLMLQLFDLIVEADDISDEQKARICKKLGEADKVNPYVGCVLVLMVNCWIY